MKKIAFVGTGMRGRGFFLALIEKYADNFTVVGLCDSNIKRCEYYRDLANSDIAVYTDFDLMLKEQKPDIVFVATIDGLHHEYIIRSLKFGCDVLTEKPMTIDEEKCLAIRQAEKETGRKVTVTFNARFIPYFAKLKQLIASNIIGQPLSIHYEYTLNTWHGGDYFKRWHRFMEKSGGMLVHKSTHHFDIVNWLLEDDPVSVSAQGARLYFGNENRPHGERCCTCEYGKTCESYKFIYTNETMQKLYYETESEDGYIRDHCAFKSDTDIYDSMSVSVAYKKGTLLTYSLNLFGMDDGFTMNIIGEKGRMEFSNFHAGDSKKEMYKIIVRYRDGRMDEIYFPKIATEHDGGDELMRDMLFGYVTEDPLGQCADSFAGMKSVMIGVAANRSIKEGVRVELAPILEKMK